MLQMQSLWTLFRFLSREEKEEDNEEKHQQHIQAGGEGRCPDENIIEHGVQKMMDAEEMSSDDWSIGYNSVIVNFHCLNIEVEGATKIAGVMMMKLKVTQRLWSTKFTLWRTKN